MMIKVCGLTNIKDIIACDWLGVDFLGFIFFKKSPRRVTTSFVAKLPPLKAKKVGVFVDLTPEEILLICREAKIDYVQLHGNYTLKDCQLIGRDRIIKVLWPQRYKEPGKFQNEVIEFKNACSFFLIDSGVSLGGHGKEVNCKWLKNINFPNKWFLAGGIGSQNAIYLAKKFKPDGIDINSAVELFPGKKNISSIAGLLKKFKGEIK